MEKYKNLKDDMIRAAKRAFDISLQSGDGGNLSVKIRNKELILIKSSGCSFGDMDYKNITLVDFNENIVEGEYKPSRELITHIQIYKMRPDITAIFHCHSPWVISIAQHFNELPPISLPFISKIGNVPVLDAGENQANEEVVKKLSEFLLLNKNIKCFIQKRHGVFCMAESIIKAEYDAELVEEASKTAILTEILKHSVEN